jgi:hypothetical protein
MGAAAAILIRREKGVATVFLLILALFLLGVVVRTIR